MAGASASSDIIEDNPDEVVLEVLAARPHPTIAVQAPHQGLVAGRPDLNELDDSHVRGERKRKGKGVATEYGESSGSTVKPRPSKPLNQFSRLHWGKGNKIAQRSDEAFRVGKTYTDTEIGVLAGFENNLDAVPEGFRPHVLGAAAYARKQTSRVDDKRLKTSRAAQLLFPSYIAIDFEKWLLGFFTISLTSNNNITFPYVCCTCRVEVVFVSNTPLTGT